MHLKDSRLDGNWSMPCEAWFILGMFGQRMKISVTLEDTSYFKHVLEKLDYLLWRN